MASGGGPGLPGPQIRISGKEKRQGGGKDWKWIALGATPELRLGPAQSKHGGLSALPLLPSFLWCRSIRHRRDEPVAHGTMGTSGMGTQLTPSCLERWPRSGGLLPPGDTALPPPLGQPPPRPIPPRPWPRLLKAAGCLSALEKRRPSGE